MIKGLKNKPFSQYLLNFTGLSSNKTGNPLHICYTSVGSICPSII